MRLRNRALLLGVLLVLLAVTGRAAGVVVQGTIVDPAGVAIPGASVELLSGTRIVAMAISAQDGRFVFQSVAPGSYEIRVTLTGFRQTRMAIAVGDTAPPAPRLKLLIGSSTETVTVASEVDVLGTHKQGGMATGAGGGVGGVVAGLAAGSPPPPGAGPVASRAGPPRILAGAPQPFETATYAPIDENKFRRVGDAPLSTFSIDVDTASYANVRRFLNEGRLPPADAVRVEELINYFHFDYPQSIQGAPFGVTTELTACPWDARHRLALIGIQAKRLPMGKTPPRNLVFLLDVSGSMAPPERLPLIKTAMKTLVESLRPEDRVAIVTYASGTRVALPATSGSRTQEIQDVISSLTAGGSTNGGAGIQLAYEIAAENFVRGGINRVILATDGDFNVGVVDPQQLVRLIEAKRSSGVFLSVLGVGNDNLKDATMEQLADKGNGNYAYLDSLSEAQRVLVTEAGSTLVTVAKDVKIQVEFNPARVGAYRLVGYENRKLRARDFNDDSKDAGELGAGHTVTVLYEIVPPGEDVNAPGVDPLKYQRQADAPKTVLVPSNELMTVKVRYKKPDGDRSTLVTVPIVDKPNARPQHVGFAAAVAEFGMLLRDSPFKAGATWADAAKLAATHRGEDADGYRAEFRRLLDVAAALDRQRTGTTLDR